MLILLSLPLDTRANLRTTCQLLQFILLLVAGGAATAFAVGWWFYGNAQLVLVVKNETLHELRRHDLVGPLHGCSPSLWDDTYNYIVAIYVAVVALCVCACCIEACTVFGACFFFD